MDGADVGSAMDSAAPINNGPLAMDQLGLVNPANGRQSGGLLKKS